MRNLMVTLWLLNGAICGVLPNVAYARASSASIGVSACNVTAAHLSNTPVNVSCSYTTPYLVSQPRGTVADLLPGHAAAVAYSHVSAPGAASNVMITTVI